MNRQERTTSPVVWVALGALALLLGACGGDDGPDSMEGQLCTNDAICGTGLWCDGGICVPGQRPGGGGSTGSTPPSRSGTDAPPPPPPRPDATDSTPTPDTSGPECTTNDDCDDGFICENGDCVAAPVSSGPAPECTRSSDCDAGFRCASGVCVPEEVSEPSVDVSPDPIDPVWIVYTQTVSALGDRRPRVRFVRSDGETDSGIAMGAFSEYPNQNEPVVTRSGDRVVFLGQERLTEDGFSFDGPLQIIQWDLNTRTQLGDPLPIDFDGVPLSRDGRWSPEFSLDDSTIFFIGSTASVAQGGVRTLYALDLATGAISELLEQVDGVRVAPGTGRLYLLRGSTLWRAAPDGSDPVQIAETPGPFGIGEFDILPDERSALYLHTPDAGENVQLRRVGFEFNNFATVLGSDVGAGRPRVMPNGTHVVVDRARPGGDGRDVYIYNIADGALVSRLTDRSLADFRAIPIFAPAEDMPMEDWE